jgi:hypothetical protein
MHCKTSAPRLLKKINRRNAEAFDQIACAYPAFAYSTLKGKFMNKVKSNLLRAVFFISVTGMTSAFAADNNNNYSSTNNSSTYSNNGLAELHYRSPQGAFLGRFDFMPDVFYRSYSPAGDPSTFGTHIHLPVTAGVGYGITDLLSVTVTEGFLFHDMSQSEHNGNLNTNSQGGFADPTLALNYRYAGALTGNFFADLVATYSPSFGTADTASFPGGGNDLRGGSSYELGTVAYWVVGQSSETSLGADVTLTGSTDSTADTTASNVTKDSYYNFDVHGDYRYHFNDRYFVDAGGTFYFMRSTDSANVDQTPIRYTRAHLPCYFVPRVDFGYLVTPNWLFTLGATYQEVTTDSYATNSGNTTATETKTVTLDAGVRFVF